MTTITKEWLQQTIAEFENTRDDIPFGLDDDDAKILLVLKCALASFEAEPIGAFHIVDQQVGGTSDYIKDGEWPIDNGVIEVYAAPPASERERIRREHAEWSDKTFGDVGPVGPLKHLSKEALEAAADPSDPLEWADMQFLLWDAQRRAGITDKQITLAMVEKLAINKTRQWPEPKDGEPRLHIKEQPASVVPDECPDELLVFCEQVIDSRITANAKADELWNDCRDAMLNGDTFRGNSISSTNNFREIAETSTNSQVIPDGWISCSERMPEQGAYISAVSRHGEYVAGQVIDDWLDLHDGTSFGLDEVYLWMMLPPLPAAPQKEVK
ncbi:DUF550 domain-containing protein [Salmonella enterica]|nr:DUF550 domain-containing protein [Salmonella enterica subsp. enterica serovar Stanleyville]EIA8884066.1 DUF550 domain-containing protein [Salmonella enterica]EDQ2747124.1 DUF550 domain-containing protein [Salmonella enterica subsp. enterica serovar Stanleyville]EEG3303802.1 DUF550 domain-containing protein [Salmonella enterica subsp. enterica serovar Stanleyville]EHT1476811.1 DUF550 domain-containing protein [Salmonella enterica subsp. enterica serovar Stanleyville]